MARRPGDLYTREMEHLGEQTDSPVAAMAARIATLWRAQGEDFLAEHHAEAVADIDRLRTAVVVESDTPVAAAERLIDRIRRLDAAAIDRVAAGRAGAIVDLTGVEPVVTVPNEEGGDPRPWRQECRRCNQYFPDEQLVVPEGKRVRPLCFDCALAVAGLRGASRRR